MAYNTAVALTLIFISSLLLAADAQSVEFSIGEVHPDLVGYWEWNSCGRYGNDNHLDYNVGTECPEGSECHCGSRGCALLTLPNDSCPSGEMHLQFYGDDGGVLNIDDALWINCCEHIWFTQYSCDANTNLVILDRNVHYAISPVPAECQGAGEVKPNKTRSPTIASTIVETTTKTPTISPTASSTISDVVSGCSPQGTRPDDWVNSGGKAAIRESLLVQSQTGMSNDELAVWLEEQRVATGEVHAYIKNEAGNIVQWNYNRIPGWAPSGYVWGPELGGEVNRLFSTNWDVFQGLQGRDLYITDCVAIELCVISLGNDDTPVDGSFEVLRAVAATSANPVLNANVNGAGWHNGINTADSFLAPFQTSFPDNTNRNVPESPDGGVFAGAATGINDNGVEYQESFYTDIENLEIGAEYTIQFWQSSTADQMETGNGESRVAQGNQGAWEVHFGDSVQLSPTLTYQGKDQASTWTPVSLTFTATATTQRLEFFSKTVSVLAQPQWVMYILVDGISVLSNQRECPTNTPSVTPTIAPVTTTSVAPSKTPSFAPTTTTEPTTDPTATDDLCTIPLGSADTPVDGSFEVLRPVAATSANSGLNSNVDGAGWHNGINTADSFLAPFETSYPGDTNRNVPESPDGGVFAGAVAVFNDDGPEYQESFYTDMEDLHVGVEYTIRFWQSSTADQLGTGNGESRVAEGNQGAWEVHFGDSVQMAPTLTYQGKDQASTWTQASLTFTATSTTERLEFVSKALSVTGSRQRAVYLLVDGITVLSNQKECPTTTTSKSPISTVSPTDSCSTWVERFDFPNHVCAPYHSDFDRSELPQEKLWTFSNLYGWYTFTLNPPGADDYVECRSLCEQTTRCASYAFQPNQGSTGGCFLYSEPDCTAIAAAGGYKIHDHKTDCSLTTTAVSTTSAVTTTVDPEKDCGSGKANYRLKDFSFRYHYEGISGLGPQFGWDLPRACGWLCAQDSRCQGWYFDTSGNMCSLSEDSEIYYDEREPGRVTAGNCQSTVSKPECPNGNTLELLGEGRCAYDSAMLDFPAAGYVLKTSKADCLSQCELNEDCIGAITAYDYYCAHYLISDVGMIDAQPSSQQTQWECHAKCHYTRREDTCNDFHVDYRIPPSSWYRRERILGSPVDGYYLPAICAKLCSNDPLCKAFQFDTSGNTCNLGNSPQIEPCGNTCGPFPGRMTSGSCDTSTEGDHPSVCPNGFIPHGEHGELNLNNHATGAWPTKTTIEECAVFCGSVDCVAYEYHEPSGLCATHTIADKDTRANPSGWISCLLETDAPTPAPTQGSHAPECPSGFYQVGDLSTNNDIGGWGMATREEVYQFRTFESCVDMCENTPGCMAFNWNHAGMCVWYDTSVPNRSDGRGFTFCARDPETTSTPTELPTFAPTTSTTTRAPTNLPTTMVQIPYDGPEFFCDTYQDPHVDTWHRAGADWRDYRIDLATSDVPLHRGDWLIFEYGAYQVIMSHHAQTLWNTNIYIRRSGTTVYSYDGRTAVRDINREEVSVTTNPPSTWLGGNYASMGDDFEYELIALVNIPLEIVWLQEKIYRDIGNPSGERGHGIIQDISLKWNEDPLITSGVCSATKDTYEQFKLGDSFITGRRELVEAETGTCPTLNQCCGRLAGFVNQFESCKQDNFDSCCSTGADAASCCGSWVQAAPRCSVGSCSNGEKCNLIDGFCYPESQVAAVSAYKGTCDSIVDHNLQLGVCSMDSGSLVCDQVIHADECDNGIAHLSKTLGGIEGETVFYDTCQFEWYAEYTCTPPVSVCPAGYIQAGDFGADIAGCGLEGCLDVDTIAECKQRCEANADCLAFSFARPQEELTDQFSCTLYDAALPTAADGHKIFCKSLDAPAIGTVTFETSFEFVNTECDEFLTPLRQVVARVSRSELRLVSAEVKNCKTGSFTLNIDVESVAMMEPLRQKVESEVFLQQLNHELNTHGKTEARTLENVVTTENTQGVAVSYVVIVGVLVLFVGIVIGFFCNRLSGGSKREEEVFDPEFGEKRQPELKPEISLKSIQDGISNNSTTMYEETLPRTLRDGASTEMLEDGWSGETDKPL